MSRNFRFKMALCLLAMAVLPRLAGAEGEIDIKLPNRLFSHAQNSRAQNSLAQTPFPC